MDSLAWDLTGLLQYVELPLGKKKKLGPYLIASLVSSWCDSYMVGDAVIFQSHFRCKKKKAQNCSALQLTDSVTWLLAESAEVVII